MRTSQQWSQEQLAKALGVRQPLVSAWERGHLPSPRMYFKFSRLLINYKDQRWLAEKAGADLKTLENIADGLRKQRHEAPLPSEIVRILPMPTIQGGDLQGKVRLYIGEEGPDLIISTAKVPHPYLTHYVQVRDSFMSPQFRPGNILVVDRSETDPWKLEEGSCLAVHRSAEYAEQQHWAEDRKRLEKELSKEEVDERRRRMSFPYHRVGLSVGWLHKDIQQGHEVGGTRELDERAFGGFGPVGKLGFFSLEAPWIREMLSARQPHFPPGEVTDASGLVVLGRVIAWIDSGEELRSEGRKK